MFTTAKIRRKNIKKIENTIANVESFLHTRGRRDVTAKFFNCAVFWHNLKRQNLTAKYKQFYNGLKYGLKWQGNASGLRLKYRAEGLYAPEVKRAVFAVFFRS